VDSFHPHSKGDTGSIRLAQKADKEDILRIIGSYPFKWDKKIAKKYYDDYFAKSSSLKKDRVYVLVSDERVVGVIGYSCDRYETGNYWLGWFYVDRAKEGRGYGTLLLNHIESEMKKKRVRRLFVTTSSNVRYRKALTMYFNNGDRGENDSAYFIDFIYSDSKNWAVIHVR
jgi:GNAT superfamily N-acetyltransferase